MRSAQLCPIFCRQKLVEKKIWNLLSRGLGGKMLIFLRRLLKSLWLIWLDIYGKLTIQFRVIILVFSFGKFDRIIHRIVIRHQKMALKSYFKGNMLLQLLWALQIIQSSPLYALPVLHNTWFGLGWSWADGNSTIWRSQWLYLLFQLYFRISW